MSVAAHRLGTHQLTASVQASPEEVVAWFGGVQAQEYGPARWALGLRLPPHVRDADVAAAFDAGRLLRTHVLRPTWHFVTPADLRWMLALTGPRVRRAMASYDRRLELDAAVLRQARRSVTRALEREPYLTRLELAAALASDGLSASGQRLAHIVLHLELDALVCSGPRRGKQFTYALVDARVPASPPIAEEEARVELVRRFFRSHGPATPRDFAWWSGLRMSDTRRILDHLRAPSIEVDGLRYWWVDHDAAPAPTASRRGVWLLPVYDEFTVAYRDRAAVPHGPPVPAGGVPRALVFHHTLVIDGQIAGTWSASPTAAGVEVQVQPLRPLTTRERQGLAAATARYGTFLGVPAKVRTAGQA